MRAPPPTWLKPLAYAAVYVGWGTTYLAIRVGVTGLPPGAFMGIRFAISALAILPIALSSGHGLRGVTRPQALHSAAQGMLILVFGLLATAYAEITLPSNVVAVAIGCAPALFALFDWLINGTRITATAALAFALGISGVALLALGGKTQGEGAFDARGFGFLAMGCVSWCFGSVLSRKLRPASSSWANVLIQYVTAAIVLIGFSLGAEGLNAETLARCSREAWIGLLYIALVPSIVSYTSYLWLLRNEPSSRVSTYAFVNPVVALIAGALILGEPVSPWIVGALALILTGTALQFRTKH